MQTENKKTVTLNASALPVKTWHYLKINDSKITLPEILNKNGVCEVKSISENCKIEKSNAKPSFNAIGAMGSDFENWFYSQNPEVNLINVENSTTAEEVLPTIFSITLNDKDEYAGVFVIKAKKDSVSKFIFNCTSTKSNTVAIYVLCDLEENAQVEISEVQIFDNESSFIFDIGATQKENSKLSITRCNFGADKSYLGIQTKLEGKNAKIESQLAYMTKNSQVLDVNDIARHTAKCSESVFNTQGVMLDSSYKNYKGTIDFVKGCSGSTGEELEDVLLLNDDVVNKTTPLILCDEDDVTGNHGATLGKIDESLLFYMRSRGIDEKTAKQMVADGKLYKIISRIPDNQIAQTAADYIDTAFTH